MKFKRKLAYTLLLATFSGSALAFPPPPSPWPQAMPDKVNAVITGGEINIKVLANDVGSGLVLTAVNQYTKEGGKASLSSDKLSINYTPANNVNLPTADAFAEDSFWYAFKDSQGRTNSTKVTVKRLSGRWPVSNADTADIDSNSTATAIPVLKNDVGVELYVSSSNGYSQKGGTVSISADKQQILYKPKANFTGTDKLWYLIKDAVGRVNAAGVTIEVSPGYTGWPQANPDLAEVTDGLSIIIPVLANDKGQGLKLTATNDWTQNGGRSKIVGDSVNYTPPSNNFTGTDAFWYDFVDSKGRTNSAKVSVKVSDGAVRSVVAFCGATYATDGTKQNTKLTSLPPEPPIVLVIGPLIPRAVTGTVAEIGNRSYRLRDNISPQRLEMTVEDQVTVIATASVGKSIAYVGTHKNKVYFVVDQKTLYSHDGSQLKKVVDSLEALVGVQTGQVGDERLTGVEFVFSTTDNFYFKVSEVTSFRSESQTTGSVFRISDTGSPVLIGSNVSGDQFGGGDRNDIVSEIYYSGGLDYYQYSSSGSFQNGNGAYSSVQTVQRKNGEILNTLDFAPERIFEAGGRTFVITEDTPARGADSRNPARDAVPSTLYVVDEDDKFVELKVCE